MTPDRTRRSRKLIQPGLQLRLALQFLGLSVLSLLFYSLILGYRLTRLTETLGAETPDLAPHLQRVQLEVVLLTIAITIPITLFVGIRATFRFAGPVYRFDRFLRGVVAGDQVEPCRLRQGDELGGLRELLNQVTERQRAANAAPDETSRAA